MNKKAITPITIVFWDLIFIMLWFLVLGGMLNTAVGMMITNGNITGVEALILGNLNLLFFICLIIFNVVFGALASGN